MPFTIHKGKPVDREIVMGGPKVQPPPIENKQGRKQMSEEKKLGKETGVKKISQEPANKQGPIGTGTEKPEQPTSGSDVTLGDEGEKDNG